MPLCDILCERVQGCRGRGGEVAGEDLHPASSASQHPALTWCPQPSSPAAGTFLFSGPRPAVRPGARLRARQAASSPRGGDADRAVTMETAEAAPASEATGRPALKGGKGSSLGRQSLWQRQTSRGRARKVKCKGPKAGVAAAPGRRAGVLARPGRPGPWLSTPRAGLLQRRRPRCSWAAASAFRVLPRRRLRPRPRPSLRVSARFPDQEAGEPHRDQGHEQLPQITLQVTSSEMTFPAIGLKEVSLCLMIYYRSFSLGCGCHEVRDWGLARAWHS
nr:uncharacterized protein LOC116154949 [Camelus dromedarius]